MHLIQTRAFDYHARSIGQSELHRVVTTPEELAHMVRVLQAQKEVGFDTETSGVAHYRHARMCGTAWACRTPEGYYQNWYVPFRHATGELQLPEHHVLDASRTILENAGITKVMHNSKFDWHMALADGIDIKGPVRDTMVEAALYDENVPLALKTRAAVDLNDPNAHLYESILDGELKKLAKEAKLGITAYKDRFGYSHLPTHLCGIYACYDTEFTLRLADLYDSYGVRSSFADTYQREIDLVGALVEMERNGLPVDVDYIHYLKDITHRAREDLEPQVFNALGGYKFNLGSDDEIRHVLTNRLGISLWKKTKSGLLSVDKEVLQEVADEHPAAALILEWRSADKINTTYTDSILKHIGYDGLLHGSFRPLGTNTGRLSSSNPNLQNFAGDSDDRALKYSGKGLEDGGVDPWSVKRAFCNRGPEWSRGYFDYSQIELRVLAHYSQDPTMLDVYLRGDDIHKRTQMEVFKDPAKKFRRFAKIINFGLSYCLSAGGFARQAKLPRDQADQFMSEFFTRYPRIAPFRQEFWSFVRQNGCFFQNMFGRPRRLPGLQTPDGYMRGRAERQAIGTLIQGTAAELTKISIIRLHRWNKEHGLGLKMCSTVHDEIQIDIPTEIFGGVQKSVKHIMEDFPEFAPIVPETDVEVSTTNWAEKADYEG